jgi:hypothetical protein
MRDPKRPQPQPFEAVPDAPVTAEEAKLLCEEGNVKACTYTVHGGESRFSLTNNDTVDCTTVTGSGDMTNLVKKRRRQGKSSSSSTVALRQLRFSTSPAPRPVSQAGQLQPT